MCCITVTHLTGYRTYLGVFTGSALSLPLGKMTLAPGLWYMDVVFMRWKTGGTIGNVRTQHFSMDWRPKQNWKNLTETIGVITVNANKTPKTVGTVVQVCWRQNLPNHDREFHSLSFDHVIVIICMEVSLRDQAIKTSSLL